MIRIGCGDHCFPWPVSSDEAIARIGELGFDTVDLIFWGGTRFRGPDDVRSDIPGHARRIRALVGDAGLAVGDVFVVPSSGFEVRACNHPDPDEVRRGREEFRDMLQFAQQVGSPGITVLPGVDFDGIDHADSVDCAAAELAERVREAAACGLALSVEPHLTSCFEDPRDVRWLLDAVPGLTLALDYSHLIHVGVSQDELDALLPFARCVHARGARPGHLLTSLERSVIDFDRMVHRLIELGYTGHITCEYVELPANHEDACDPVAANLAMREVIRRACST